MSPTLHVLLLWPCTNNPVEHTFVVIRTLTFSVYHSFVILRNTIGVCHLHGVCDIQPQFFSSRALLVITNDADRKRLPNLLQYKSFLQKVCVKITNKV